MSWIDTRRIIRSGFLNFSRSGVVSIASVLVVTVTLSVVTFLIFLQAVLSFSLSEIEDKVDITVYLTLNASQTSTETLVESIKTLPEVKEVTYLSREQALERFREEHKDDYLTLQALDELGDNPLGASLNIRAIETSQYEGIAKFLESPSALASDGSSIIEKVNYFQNKQIIDRLTNIIASARTIGLIVTLLLVVVSVIITFNTIRLTIYIAREEISVMRLVGAENKYITGPFMIEGVIYGVIASVVTMIIFLPITIWLGRSMTDFFGINLFNYYVDNFFQVFFIIVISGIFLGSLSSFLAIRKYLTK
ncbi:MAG: permease-like cell division protein FtsX [Candidatus Pacebacteria bacterium]|nr:permease-like cell division protein FtsX [Candidatus Paceibacterota bacterium]